MSVALEMNVELVSPSKSLAKVRAAKVQIPGKGGYLGILPGHAALVTELGMGRLVVEGTENGQPVELFINGGYMEVVANQVIVLLDLAETKADIDISRAERSRQRALERLTSKDANIDVLRAQMALARADARLAFVR